MYMVYRINILWRQLRCLQANLMMKVLLTLIKIIGVELVLHDIYCITTFTWMWGPGHPRIEKEDHLHDCSIKLYKTQLKLTYISSQLLGYGYMTLLNAPKYNPQNMRIFAKALIMNIKYCCYTVLFRSLVILFINYLSKTAYNLV